MAVEKKESELRLCNRLFGITPCHSLSVSVMIVIARTSTFFSIFESSAELGKLILGYEACLF